jgi:capsular exopolysaccharide synthesis family protein
MADIQPQTNRNLEIDTDDHMINDLLKQYTRHWKWFIIVVAIAIGSAHLYLRYVTNIYTTQAKILLKDEKGGGDFSEFSALEDLGIFGGSGNKIADQIEVLNSRRLMQEVVKELNINIEYFSQGNVKKLEYYKSPVTVSFLNQDTLNAIPNVKTLRLLNQYDDTFRLSEMDGQDGEIYKYGQTIDLGFGPFNIIPNEEVNSKDWNDIEVQIRSIKTAASIYSNQVSISAIGKNTNVLIIAMESAAEEKSRDIINNLIEKYNLDGINDKNQVASNTAKFIENRLRIISEELDSVETTKETFKRDNRLTDIPTEAAIVVNSKSELKKSMLELATQISIGKELQNYVDISESSLLPANLGIFGSNLETQIQEYNTLILQRDNLLNSATPENPVVVTLDSEREKIRATIKNGLQNELANLEIRERDLQRQERLFGGQIAAVPGLEKEARGIVRQQEIKEQLYLYLLKKREETAISLAIKTANAKVIDEAITSSIPVSPQRQVIKLVAGVLGFIVVVLIIYLKNLLDVKIHSRSDVELLTKTPILGELPFVDGDEDQVIKKFDRSILAESFRILRTNLDYFTRGEDGKKKNILYVTSTIKGEGKTFVAFNLAITLASTGKKVLLVGADIRNPQVHRYLDLTSSTIGLSEYMFDDSVTSSEIISKQSVNSQELDVVLSGRIPPNPAELFLNNRFGTLIGEVSEAYDYVIVDTAPTMQVTDTLLISQYADVTVFVSRAEYTQKRLLQYSQDLYKEGKLKNMTYVINGVKSNNFGYGAKYGYGYGNETEGIWNRFKNFLSGK